MNIEGRVGYTTAADGVPDQIRLERTLGQVVQDAHGRYYEPASRGTMFSSVLTATTTGISAGNLVAAAAAAITQFALINPANSGKNLALVKFGLGIISGTPAAGPVFHGYITNAQALSVAATGSGRSCLLGGGTTSVGVPWSVAAGSALTGCTVGPLVNRLASFTTTATAQATPGMVVAVEELAGDLIIPPGTIWVPLWAGAGSSLLNAYSITWEEVPV